MESNNDSEFLPSSEVLASFRQVADTKIRPLGRAFWEKLDITEDKTTHLASRLRQREAVTRLIKDDLGQKLLTFGIFYFTTFFFTLCLIVSLSSLSYDSGVSDKLKIIVASNGVYYSFIMMLGLFYPLARKVRWPLTVVAFLFITLWPLIHDRVLALVSLKAVLLLAATVLIPASLIFINATRTGRRLLSQLAETRQHNKEENSNREEFVKRVEEMFPAQGNRLQVMVRRFFLRSAARVAFSILINDEYTDRKGALLEFTKRQKFKDSMGRLTGAVWIASALAYLILPQIPEVEMISSAAVGVLPVYYFSMLIMNAVDEASEEALTDVAELIKSNTELG